MATRKISFGLSPNAIKDAVDVYDCDIINMSLGLVNYTEKLEECINCFFVVNNIIFNSADILQKCVFGT